MNTELELAPAEPAAVVKHAPANDDAMLSLVERMARDPNVDVDKLERLLVMAREERTRLARIGYDAAMNSAQSEMEPVRADSKNPQTHSRYASYYALDCAMRPVYTKHGFGLSFGTKVSQHPDRVIVTCRVSHRDGHNEFHEVDMPADGKGAKGNDVMTKTHATGSALSYGQRYLLKLIFNVAWRSDDDDGNAAGHRHSPPERQPDPAPSQPARPAAPSSSRASGGAAPEFLEKCKRGLLRAAASEFYWAWWRYAAEKGWILPSQESLADAKAEVMFAQCVKPEDFKARFESLQAQVMEQAKNCSVELRDEILRTAVPMPEAALKEPSAAKPASAPAPTPGKAGQVTGCPKCKGHASAESEKVVDARVCKKCGWQWNVKTGMAVEAHDYFYVVCPIPPRGMKRDEYQKNPITMGQMARVDNDRWYGFVLNTTVAEARKGREFNGKHYDPSPADLKWAEACEKAKAHLDAQETKASDYTGDSTDPDDVPFRSVPLDRICKKLFGTFHKLA